MITHAKITYQLKFLEKMTEFFFYTLFNKYVRKITCNMRISSNS